MVVAHTGGDSQSFQNDGADVVAQGLAKELQTGEGGCQERGEVLDAKHHREDKGEGGHLSRISKLYQW